VRLGVIKIVLAARFCNENTLFNEDFVPLAHTIQQFSRIEVLYMRCKKRSLYLCLKRVSAFLKY